MKVQIKTILFLVLMIPFAAFSGRFDPMTEAESEALRVEMFQKNYEYISNAFKKDKWVDIYLSLSNFIPPININNNLTTDATEVQREIKNFMGTLPIGTFQCIKKSVVGDTIFIGCKITHAALDAIHGYPYIKNFRQNINHIIGFKPIEIVDGKSTLLRKEKVFSDDLKKEDVSVLYDKINQTQAGILIVNITMLVPRHINNLEQASAGFRKIVNRVEELVALSGLTTSQRGAYEALNQNHLTGEKVYLYIAINQDALNYLSQNKWVQRIKG